MDDNVLRLCLRGTEYVQQPGSSGRATGASRRDD